MSNRTKALLAIVVVSFFWGTAGAAKPLIRVIDPYTVAFLRFFVATLIILPFFILTKAKNSPSLLPLLPLGLWSTANVALYYVGLKTSTANAAAIIYTATPLVIAIVSQRLTQEKFTRGKIVGILLGLCGSFFIALLPFLEHGQQVSGSLSGNLLFVIAIITWVFYSIGSQRAITRDHYSPIAITTVSLVTSTVVFGIASLFVWKPYYGPILMLPTNILLILYLGIAVTVITFLLFQWVIRHSSATIASLYIYLQVICAVLFNHIFLGEPITQGFLIGSVLTITGVLIALRK